jgi:hypothetical protein
MIYKGNHRSLQKIAGRATKTAKRASDAIEEAIRKYED